MFVFQSYAKSGVLWGKVLKSCFSGNEDYICVKLINFGASLASRVLRVFRARACISPIFLSLPEAKDYLQYRNCTALKRDWNNGCTFLLVKSISRKIDAIEVGSADLMGKVIKEELMNT